MKVVTVVGARPQFVKCAAVSRELRSLATEVLVHTGQHYDFNMSDVFFEELEIPRPNYNLKVGSGSHGAQTGEMLRTIEEVLLTEDPQIVLLYGDTNSTLAGALAAAKLHIPVAHVEAGLRSFNRRMPEEINRIVTDHVSSLLFCPTPTAVENLRHEGITVGVSLVGDVMEDSLLHGLAMSAQRSTILEQHSLRAGQYYLATVHRAENTDDPHRLRQIIEGFKELGSLEVPVVFAVHPRTLPHLTRLGATQLAGLICIEPMPFIDMIALESNAKAILTDSGGVQKEAAWLGVPCVTLRDETEWVETVASGWNLVVGTDPGKIISAARRPKPDRNVHQLRAGAASEVAKGIVGFSNQLISAGTRS